MVEENQKRYSKCGVLKVLDDFNKTNDRASGRTSWCKACSTKRGRAWYSQDPQKFRDKTKRNRNYPRERVSKAAWALKKYYKITPQEYEALSAAQGGMCALCGKPPGKRRLAVDHNHKTDRNRALLCGKCNTGLGHFNDDLELLNKAIAYLHKWETL